jgi:mono/diheme cytochrome c family protein
VAAFQPTDDITLPLVRVAEAKTAVEPIAVTVTGDMLVVASAWGRSVEAFKVPSLTREKAVKVGKEPRAITATKDRVYVAHAAESSLTAVDLEKGEALGIDMGMKGWEQRLHNHRMPPPPIRRPRPPNLQLDFMMDDPEPFMCGTAMRMMMRTVQMPPRFARQAFALAKLDERVFVPHVKIATGDPTVMSSGYGGGGGDEEVNLPTEMFDVEVVENGKKATGDFTRVAMGARLGCRLPRAAAVDNEKKALVVACMGNDKLIWYDAKDPTPSGAVRRTWVLDTPPSAIAIDGERIVVWSQLDRTVVVARFESEKDIAKIELPSRGELSLDARQGRKLFHKAGDPKISGDGRACASCHPDGRDDALVWSTPEGPRQTISLAGRLDRKAPFGWRGQHTSIEQHMEQTIKNLHGSGLSAEEFKKLAAYLKATKAPPAQPVGDKEKRGRAIFASADAGCAGCHERGDVYDVGSAAVGERNRSFLAPSLKGIGESAPYFHDGRYATLRDLLKLSDGKMGQTSHLGEADLDALEAYLRTL